MIVPFPFWTTSSSGDTLEAGGAAAGAGGDTLFSAVSCFGLRQPARIAPAEAARAARPSSRRLNKVALSRFGGPGAHVPHPVVLQLPQLLAGLLMTFNELSMALLLSRKVCWIQLLQPERKVVLER